MQGTRSYRAGAESCSSRLSSVVLKLTVDTFGRPLVMHPLQRTCALSKLQIVVHETVHREITSPVVRLHVFAHELENLFSRQETKKLHYSLTASTTKSC